MIFAFGAVYHICMTKTIQTILQLKQQIKNHVNLFDKHPTVLSRHVLNMKSLN